MPCARSAACPSSTPSSSSQLIRDKMKLMQMDESFLNRGVNEGFSGGEKKRNEILQMALLEPKLAHARRDRLRPRHRRAAGRGERRQQPALARARDRAGHPLPAPARLHRARPRATCSSDGRILRSGDRTLALELEKRGYDWVRQEAERRMNATARLGRSPRLPRGIRTPLQTRRCAARRQRRAAAIARFAELGFPERARRPGNTRACGGSRARKFAPARDATAQPRRWCAARPRWCSPRSSWSNGTREPADLAGCPAGFDRARRWHARPDDTPGGCSRAIAGLGTERFTALNAALSAVRCCSSHRTRTCRRARCSFAAHRRGYGPTLAHPRITRARWAQAAAAGCCSTTPTTATSSTSPMPCSTSSWPRGAELTVYRLQRGATGASTSSASRRASPTTHASCCAIRSWAARSRDSTCT